MFVGVNGQRLFFDVVGDGLAIEGPKLRQKPVLLVLHGGPGFDHSSMRPQFDAFADIAQVVYLDHRGNGRSWPSDPATWTLAQWGDDIAAFCDALGIARPIVFGQSFGGMVAQSYATRHPGHAGGLVFSSTAARMDFPAALAIFAAKGGAEARQVAERFWNEGSDAHRADYMTRCMPLYNTRPRPDAENAAARATPRMEVYRHFSLPGGEIHRMDFRPALARVTGPAQVLAGVEDPITPPHLAEEIAARLTGTAPELHIWPDTGHGPFRDRPDLVFPIVRAFIARAAGA